MAERLFFVGYRGTGKTSVGKKAASLLGYSFVDTDDLIMEIAGMPIPQIFSAFGEEKFRDFETQALKKAVEKDKTVIACGGGLVLREENRALLKKNGTVCLLASSPEIIFRRIHGDGNRPSLTGKNPFDEIVFLLKKRAPFYHEVKDFEVDSNRKIGVCAKEAVETYLRVKAARN